PGAQGGRWDGRRGFHSLADRHMTVPDAGPRSRFEGLPAYQRAAVPEGTRLRLDANEGVPPTMDLVWSALHEHGAELFRRYPNARPLEAALARHHGVDASQVFVGAGADEVVDRCCRAFLYPASTMLMAQPGFEMFEHYAALCGARLAGVEWRRGPYPSDAVCRAIRDDVSMVALVTPNNPTGEVATIDDLRNIAAAAPNALVVLDHAYVEFADQDLTPEALAMPNVVVVRTFSKAWGLAGCRVGYAIGPRRIVQTLRAMGGPFPVSGVSLAVAGALLERGKAHRDAFVARVRAERGTLFSVLEELGANPRASQTNFVFCETGPATLSLKAAMAREGIVVRAIVRGSGEALGLRIALPGDAASFEILVRAVRAALAEAGDA
ncbi:MAG TPA: histidinol-phosphate transaminase, partial [Gemmatimonadaceae bacterium]